MIRIVFSHLILLIFLLVFGTLGFFAFTTSGLELGIALIACTLPGKITIQDVDGSLFSALSLKKITYTDDKEKIIIDSLDIAWRPIQLLNEQLNITNFHLGKTSVEILKKAPESSFNFSNLQWLKYINIKQATLSSLQIEEDHHTIFHAESILIGKDNHENYFSTNMLGGKIEGKFSYKVAHQIDWATTFSIKNLDPDLLFAPKKHRFKNQVNVSVIASGDDKNATFKITQLNGLLHNHVLHGNADIIYKNNQLFINQSELHIANANLSVTGSITDHWDIHWNVLIPNVSTLLPESKGSFQSSGEITGTRITPNINADIDVNHFAFADNKIDRLNGKLFLSFLPKKKSILTLETVGIHIANYDIKKTNIVADGNFNIDHQTLNTAVRITIDQQPVIFSNVSFPDFYHEQQKITGSVLINASKLDVLADFIPGIKQPTGKLQGEIQLSGELFQPVLNAKLDLTNANVSIPDIGITLTHINLQSRTDANNQLHISGTLQSGNGDGKVQGVLDLSNLKFSASFTLRGTNLSILNLEHYKIIASPDLTLTFLNSHLALQGTLSVPEAEITPTNFSNTLTLPDEVIFVGQPEQHAINYFSNMSLQLNLILGDNITFKYQNLQTNLGGKIQITQTPGSPAMGSGELYTTKGTYRAYGKLLDIQQGRLIYTGNTIINPGLNIRAGQEIKTVPINSGTANFSTTKVIAPIYTGRETINVGVQIQGTVQSPMVSLFSNPTMSQGDMLSYLLFGYPQSQATGSNQIGALLSATSAMNLGGKTPSLVGITQNIQDKFGLNELTVGSAEVFDPTKGTAVSTTSFMVGKQLAKNLYLHYSIGLFNPISILNLRYQLTKRWAIQSETSTIDSGADLQYGFERD